MLGVLVCHHTAGFNQSQVTANLGPATLYNPHGNDKEIDLIKQLQGFPEKWNKEVKPQKSFSLLLALCTIRGMELL